MRLVTRFIEILVKKILKQREIYISEVQACSLKNEDLSIFGFMHEYWTILTVNMMYTRSQSYTNVVVGRHGMQTFEIVIVVLLL